MAEKIEGRKQYEYQFEFGNEELKKQINKIDKVKGLDKIKDLESKFKYLSFTIQEPTFEEISAALSQRLANNSINVIGAGKVIWELCCIKKDKEIESNPKVLISLCVDLYNYFVEPIDVEIKKK